LLVIYMGHNEFLESRSYGHVQRWSGWRAGVYSLAANFRLFHGAALLWQRYGWQGPPPSAPGGRTKLQAEVDALLDYRGGLAAYHRDDAWHQGVVEHFRFTLLRMVREARAAQVPVLLIDPVCNLKDCPPFKVAIDAQLSEPERLRLAKLLDETNSGSTSREEDVERLRQTLAIDGRHAGAWYLLGKALLAAGDARKAYDAFVRAKDEDVCPLRIVEPLRDALYAIGAETETPVVGVAQLFASRSPGEIPGDELLLDHVHPSITGHQMIAELLVETLAARGTIVLPAGWKERQRELYDDHFARLDTPYFARGQEHLEGLRKWTQGRATKLRRGATGATGRPP
jgi:hypothetical protein